MTEISNSSVLELRYLTTNDKLGMMSGLLSIIWDFLFIEVKRLL